MNNRLLRAAMPPFIYSAAAKLRERRRGQAPPYEFVPGGWQGNLPFSGWNAESVLASYQAGWPDFVESVGGTQPQHLGASYGLLAGHNVVACFSYALALVAQNKRALSILDWGGGIGHYYLRSRAALPHVALEYHCKDVPLLAGHGRTLFPEAVFSSDESCFDRRYDFVLASTSLHYSEDWRRVLTALADSAQDCLMLNRLPCHEEGPSYVYRQNALGSRFLSWSFNAGDLLRHAEAAGLSLFREFLISDGPQPIQGAPSPSQMRAYLFRRSPRP